jgi:hypothetical protein
MWISQYSFFLICKNILNKLYIFQEALLGARMAVLCEISPALQSINLVLNHLRRPKRLESIYLNPDFVSNIKSMYVTLPHYFIYFQFVIYLSHLGDFNLFILYYVCVPRVESCEVALQSADGISRVLEAFNYI